MSTAAAPTHVPAGAASREDTGALRSTRLFRADLTDYALRRSTWVTLLILLAVAAWITINETSSRRRLPPEHVAEDLAELVASMTLVMSCFFGYLAGAAWMASQHTSGSLGTWLAFHPRRSRVWLSKLLVVIAVPTALGLLGLCASIVPLLAHPQLLHPDLAGDLTAKLIAIATVSSIGFAITSVGRHLLWSLGAVVGYLMAFLLGVSLGLDVFLPHVALQRLVEGSPGGDWFDVAVLPGGARLEGGIIWLAWWALAIGLALLHFRRTSID